MNLNTTNEIKNLIIEENMPEKNNELGIENKLNSDSLELSNEDINLGVDKTINDVTKVLENNIKKEIENLNLNSSIFEKISKNKMMDVVKVAIESILKGVLKLKFGINFSTFNDMKETINDVMDGNLKDAIKTGSDAAIDKLTMLDGTTRTTIKSVKNAVIDKTIDSEKYEIVNKQTKILNRISNNCEAFNVALSKNDVENIKKKATAIKNDMKKILPIRETINMARCALDKYSLWQNKGNKALTVEENELIEKLNIGA